MANKDKKNINVSVIVLSILLGVSVLFNLILFFSVTIIDTDWENEYNNLNMQWCEISNKQGSITNDLITILQNYDSAYDEVIFSEIVDCWG